MKAYALGYLSSTGPRLLGLLRTLRRNDRTLREKFNQVYAILRISTQLNRFPTACAVIVGGATILPHLVNGVVIALVRLVKGKVTILRDARYLGRLRFICTFLASLLAFNLLNRDEKWTRKRAQSRSSAQTDQTNLKLLDRQQEIPPQFHPHYAGKTIDFTLFAICRAVDVAIITAWSRTRSKPWHPVTLTPKLAQALKATADPAIFASSAAIIMWSWFYSPERLPRAYNHWISAAASIDHRLIECLRLARRGEYLYGQDTGQAHLIEGLCKDLDLPEEWGDPCKTIPIPCSLVHMNTASSCELHGLHRFWGGWKFAMEMYLPLQLIIRMRSRNLKSLASAVKNATVSSTFLGAFVAAFYYSVCLARTRLGPKLFSYKTITPQMWDSGLCVLAGCLACGWSILLEKPNRRQEIAFFVAPRAMATVLPRVYDKQYRRREQLVFATCVAIVLTAAGGQDSRRVRGVLGRVLERVLRT